MSGSRTCLGIVCVMAPCALWVLVSAAPPPRAGPPAGAREHSPAAGMNFCINTLTDEAKKSKADGALVRPSRSFAKEYGGTLPPQLLLERITRRIDSDPFIDAYVRWQLTAFDPALRDAALTDASFERLLSTLPAPVENPRAGEALIRALSAAVQAGQLSPAQREQANATLNELASRTSAAEALNVPALEFRQWLIDEFQPRGAAADDAGHFVAALMLERAAALALAGWPCEDAKRQVDAALQRLARSRDFTLERRRELIRRAEKLISTGRMHVASASIAGEALAVEYGTTGIFDFDVRRWERMLREQ